MEDPEGILAGAAHDAAWSTVKSRPSEGWRNSYGPEETAMQEAHIAAHHAMIDAKITGQVSDGSPAPFKGKAYWAAYFAIYKARHQHDTTPYLERIPLTSLGRKATHGGFDAK